MKLIKLMQILTWKVITLWNQQMRLNLNNEVKFKLSFDFRFYFISPNDTFSITEEGINLGKYHDLLFAEGYLVYQTSFV